MTKKNKKGTIKDTKNNDSIQTVQEGGSFNLQEGLDAQASENAEKINRRKLDALKKGIHKMREGQEEDFSVHIIGVGNAGASVIEQVGKDVAKNLTEGGNLRFSALAIDVGDGGLEGVEKLKEILPESCSHIETLGLEIPKRDDLFSTLRRMREFLKLEYPRYYWNPNYEPWLPTDTEYPDEGESLSRSLSKAFYAKAYYDGERPAKDAIKRFTESADASTGNSVVVIVFGLGGGTGSGIVVDLARHVSNVNFGRRAIVFGMAIAPCSGDAEEHRGGSLYPTLNELDCMGDRSKNDGVTTVWGDLYRDPFTGGMMIVPQEPTWQATKDLKKTHDRVNREISSLLTRKRGGDFWEALRMLSWVGAPPTQHAAARTPFADNWIHILGFADKKVLSGGDTAKQLGIRESYRSEYVDIRADESDSNQADKVINNIKDAFKPIATMEVSLTKGTVDGSVQFILPCIKKTDLNLFFESRKEYDKGDWESKLNDHSWLLDLGVLLSEPAIRFNGMAGECLWGCACWVVVPYEQLRGPEDVSIN